MLTKVYNYVKTHKLIEKGDRILVGVSGGADSVCLLHILTPFTKREVDLLLFMFIMVSEMRRQIGMRPLLKNYLLTWGLLIVLTIMM